MTRHIAQQNPQAGAVRRIALVTLVAVLHTAGRDPYAAVTRPDAARRPLQPSYAYRLASLARRTAFARLLAGPEVRHG